MTSGTRGAGGAQRRSWPLRAWASRTTWAPRVLARLTAVVGVLLVATEVVPHSSRPEWDVVVGLMPPLAPTATRPLTIAAGMALCLLAGGLRRRKRRAWVLAILVTAVTTSLHLLRTREPEVIVLGAALMALLGSTHAAFGGVADPRSRRRTVSVAVGSFATAFALGAVVVLVDPDTEAPRTLWFALQQVLLGIVGLPGPVHPHEATDATYQSVTLALLGGVAVVATVATLLRAPDGPAPLGADDERRLRALLAGAGPGDSLGYFALRRDRCAVFSPSGKAAVGYRVVAGVSLAAGDPLGDPEAWPGAIRAWLDEARRYAWVPGVLGAGERAAHAYARAGLSVLELGDEAVVEVDRFTVEGRPMRGVRQAVARARRLGCTTTVDAVCDLSPDELDEAREAADRWREGARERGFAMALGRFGDPSDPECVLVRCRDAGGTLRGLLHLVPWGEDGLSLDLMRRAPDGDNGVVELMVTDLVAAAARRGTARVSLNFAVFRSVFERGDRLGAGPVIRLSRRLLLLASRFWQLESLYRANAKYRPTWVPRFVCYESGRDLGRLTMAALEAESFLVRPRLAVARPRGRRLVPQSDALAPQVREDAEALPPRHLAQRS